MLREHANLYKTHLYKQHGKVAAICRQAKRARPTQTVRKMSSTSPTTSLSLAHRLQVVRSKLSRSVTLEEVYDIKHATGHTDQHRIEFRFVLVFLIVLER